jgi:hypothetical protein
MRALLLLCAGLLACKQAQPEARRVVPPSEQEAEAFAKDFVTHVAPCNANELDLRIDDDLVIARAFAKRKVEDDVIRGFKRGFGGVGVFLCRKLSLEPNVAAAYLRSNRVDGTPRPIVRLVMDGAINYLDSRVAALMRAIQRRRKSRLRFFRSRYE